MVDGGYLLPVEFHDTLIAKLENENVMRQISRVITTASEHRISILTTAPTASWLSEGEEIATDTQMQDLATAIICANNLFDRATEIHDAIIMLSNNSVATDVLAWELRDAAIGCENLWRDIEQRDDFKAKYGTDRDKALEDFYNGILK